MPELEFLLKGIDRYKLRQKYVGRLLLPGLLPGIDVDWHGDEGFEDGAGTLLIFGEYDQNQAKFVTLCNFKFTSWLKDVSENLRLLNRATPLLPISFLVSPSTVTSWMQNSTIFLIGQPEVISQQTLVIPSCALMELRSLLEILTSIEGIFQLLCQVKPDPSSQLILFSIDISMLSSASEPSSSSCMVYSDSRISKTWFWFFLLARLMVRLQSIQLHYLFCPCMQIIYFSDKFIATFIFIQIYMEFLQAVYQQRLDQLSRLFLRLLQQLQTTITPFSQPLLAPHKIQYLVHIIVNTLTNQREQEIYRLSQQLQQLKQHSSLSVKGVNRNSAFTKDSVDFQPIELSLKIPNPSQHLKTQSKNISYIQKITNTDESMCQSSKSSAKTKNSSSQGQARRDYKNRTNSKCEQSQQEELQFQFKYLRI